MILDIHLEYCDDKGERLEKIAKLGKPFNISVVPVLLLPEHEVFKNGVYPNDYFYPKEILGLTKELAKESNISFGQQGFSHYCRDCYKTEIKTDEPGRKFRHDPWHENKCLYGMERSVKTQKTIIDLGKKVIQDILNVLPILYVPPNHQYDVNTKIAAKELGYKYFGDRGIINVHPYRENELIILPERDLGQKGEIFYTHYDEMKNNFEEYLELIKNSESLENIELFKKSEIKIGLNYKLLLGRKRIRDLKKRIG